LKSKHLFKAFSNAGKELYLVGGYVRDQLLGLENHDFDFATNALPEETIAILKKAGYKAIPLGIEFGTVITHDPKPEEDLEFQITTYRCKENYKKGSRKPTVVFGGNLREDLIRRDFTINAMAMDSDGEITDLFGGIEDLEKKVIRTPLNPVVTFEEDPLRMLRAFRFACKLGFSIEEKTFDAIKDMHCEIINVSHERWKMEMDKILGYPNSSSVADTLQMMKESGLLTDLIPEYAEVFLLDGISQGRAHYADIWNHTLDVIRVLETDDICVRWAALLHDIGKPATRTEEADGSIHYYRHENIGAEITSWIAGRFRFSKKEKDLVVFLVQKHMRPGLYSSEWGDRAVRKLIREAGERLDDLLSLSAADIASLSEEYAKGGAIRQKELRERIAKLSIETKKKQLPAELGGKLMEKVGIDLQNPSEIGIVLHNLEELVLEGKLPSMAEPKVYLDYLEHHPEIKKPPSA